MTNRGAFYKINGCDAGASFNAAQAAHREVFSMACFLVPVTEAVIVTVAAGVVKAKKKKAERLAASSGTAAPETEEKKGFGFVRKLRWLAGLLWGGAFLLAFEHLWHGEIVPWFPFLTAAAEPESAAEMLTEMGTVGVTMAAIVTAVWAVMVVVTHFMEKRASSRAAASAAEV